MNFSLAVAILDVNLKGPTANFDEMGLMAVRSAWLVVKAALPAESSAKGSEPSCDEGNPATDEPPLYISREEGNSSSQSLPSAENSNAEPSAS